MITKEDVEKWAAIATPILTFCCMVWRKIRQLEIKTDGMMLYRSRADRAEGQMEGRDFQHDREKKERGGDETHS